MKSTSEIRSRLGDAEGAEKAKVLALAHCILNQATRWQSGEKTVSSGPVKEVLDLLSSLEIGALQLPCPEFSFCGNPRPPRTKDEYACLPGFQSHCERLAKSSAQRLKSLISQSGNPRIEVLAIIGVERSPTCGIDLTPYRRGVSVKYENEKGLFMEKLELELKRLGIEIPMLGLDLNQPSILCRKVKDISKSSS